MQADKPVQVAREGAVARVTLRRPEVHNAFDATTIQALGEAVGALAADGAVRAIVLAGAGKSFCAGGDLRWMRETAGYAREDNVADALALTRMLAAVDRCPKPVIARVHGLALGGGTGLLAACDLVLAAEGTRFGFSEVRLGLIPAAISPFVVRRIGEARARALMLTGQRIDAARALAIGLVDEVHTADALDEAVDARVQELLQGGPEAQRAIKELVRAVAGRPPEEVAQQTAEAIADSRAGQEGQEGVRAFLEKRAPTWRPAP